MSDQQDRATRVGSKVADRMEAKAGGTEEKPVEPDQTQESDVTVNVGEGSEVDVSQEPKEKE